MSARTLPVCALMLLTFACAAKETPAPAPTPTPVVPACQKNNTATITFENRSTSNATYTVLWDGSTWTTLAPTVKSQEYTVAASIQHTLVFRVSNTGSNACTPSTPTLAQCSSSSYWCSY
jgi:hypothetical protein